MRLVNEAEKELSGKGRVLLRYSGTEPKIRLLIEGREFAMIDKQADRIADAIQSAIGAVGCPATHELSHALLKPCCSAHKNRSLFVKSPLR